LSLSQKEKLARTKVSFDKIAISIIQPALPRYRLDFFQRIERRFPKLKVLSSYSVNTYSEEKFHWECRLKSPKKLPGGLYWQSGALRVFSQKNDVIVLTGNARYISNVFIILLAKLKHVKTVWWGQYRSPTSSRLSCHLRTLISSMADYRLFYTDQELSEFVASRKASAPRAFALNNGIDVSSISQFLKPYEARDRPRRILFIGRFTEKSEVLLLLKALSLPQCEGIEAQLIGEGDLFAAAEKLAQRLGISDRVNFLGEVNEESSIAKLANTCRMLVYPGCVGLSLIHGMAYELPSVLHSDESNHMPEIAAFESGSTGVVFDRGNAESLANEIAGIIDDTNSLNRFSLNSIAIVTRSFNTSDMTERFEKMISRILDDMNGMTP